MAYTSDSTAENQKVSEKVYANAPTNPAPIILIRVPWSISSSFLTRIFFAKAVIVQNKNRMVNALETAEPTFIQ